MIRKMDKLKLDVMTWLTTLGVDHRANNWYRDPVFHPNHLKHIKYFKELCSSVKTIDPRKIIGISHDLTYNFVKSYLDDPILDWSDLLVHLQGINGLRRDFQDRESLLNHITRNKSSIQVHKYGNHYFSTDGQHRLCLAKFMGIPSIEVQVVEFYFDKKLFQREMCLQKHLETAINYGFKPYIMTPEITQENITLKINNKSIFVKKEFVPQLLESYKSIKKSCLKTNFLALLEVLPFFNISSISSLKDINKLSPLLAIHHKNLNGK